MSLPTSIYTRMPKQKPLSLGFDKYSLNFDGTTQYGLVPDILDSSLPFELMAIVKNTTNAGLRSIVDQRDHNCLGQNSTSWKFMVYSIPPTPYEEIHVLKAVPVGKWAFLEGVWDGIQQHIYENCILRGSRVATAAPVNFPQNWFIGVCDWDNDGFPNGRWWLGKIAMIMAYQRVLTDWERRYLMLNYHQPIMSGLRLWLDFEEGTGLVANDISGNGFNASLLPVIGPPTWLRNKKWEIRAEVKL